MLEELMLGGGISSLKPELIALLVIIVIWDIVWKLLALWKAGRNNQLAWFIFIAIINSAGILPILYLTFFQKKVGEKKVRKK